MTKETSKKATTKKATTKKATAKKVSPVHSSDVPIQVALKDIVVREGVNPRREINDKDLADLMASIEVMGVMVPVGVAPYPEKEGKYELIWGERRYRAAQLLKLSTISAVVKDGHTREDLFVMRMTENMQREDLNCMDEAVAFQNYLSAMKNSSKGTAKALAQQLGKKPAYISQRLKILRMPPEVQLALTNGEINFTQIREMGRLSPEEQLKTLSKVQLGLITKSGGITRIAEKERASKQLDDATDAETKRRGRPPRTKDNAPDIQQGLNSAIEALQSFAVENKSKKNLKEGLVTVYTRFIKARSSTKKEQLTGAIQVLEWVLGIRNEL